MDSVLLQQYAGITWKMWVCKIALQRDLAPASQASDAWPKTWPAHVMTRQLNKAADCLLMAQSEHLASQFQCPLSEVKQTSRDYTQMSAFGTKRTLRD